jgi:predicted nuclease of predicted toxin-antitoxin system
VKFLVDAQLPPALARWLREAGHDAAHVEDVGLREATDGPIWEHALRTGAAVVTKDEDFAARAARATKAQPPVIVWLRVGNTTNRVLRALVEPRLPGIVELIRQGHRMVEVI